MTDYEKILSRAANLCSATEKCSFDIQEKVQSWGLSEAEAIKAVKYLEEQKFVDNSRYAKVFVKDKLKFNKWGRIKISYSLRQKDIPDEIISLALDEIDPGEFEEVLSGLLRTKLKSVGNIRTASNKAKLIRFAAQRGFTSEEIYRVIRKIEGI